MNGIRVVERVRVTTGDGQVASHVGLHLLGEIAERTGLAFEYSAAVPGAGKRAPVHDRGRLLSQVAVMLAGGGVCVVDMAALRDQPSLFGEVASDATIWRTFQGAHRRPLQAEFPSTTPHHRPPRRSKATPNPDTSAGEPEIRLPRLLMNYRG